MNHWAKVIMIAALFLLTAAAYDLLVIDFLSPAFCDQASSENRSSGSSDDDCFCCCAHIVLTVPADVEPVQISAIVDAAPATSAVSSEPAGIYHPPRA